MADDSRSDADSKPRCPHYPNCEGCPLIGTPYGRQLERKREIVREAFALHTELATLPVPEVIGSPRLFGYRTQAKLVVRATRQGLLLGVYRPGSHRVADISCCAVQHPLINQVLAAARGVIERQRVPIYNERTAAGWLRYLTVRVSCRQRSAQVVPVVRDRTWSGRRDFAAALRRIRAVRSVVFNVNPRAGNTIFGDTYVAVTREDALIERIGDLRLLCRAGVFLQSNIAVARRVYERVSRWAEVRPEETAVDLYAGVGAITFGLATRARAVWGIEAAPRAVVDAKSNVRLNGFHNVRFIEGDAGPALSDLAARIGKVDLVTLNPPRKGADEAAREAIGCCAPARIVYVSCNPATLARDLACFVARGYALVAVQPFDMLPQTDHVECVALLRRV